MPPHIGYARTIYRLVTSKAPGSLVTPADLSKESGIDPANVRQAVSRFASRGPRVVERVRTGVYRVTSIENRYQRPAAVPAASAQPPNPVRSGRWPIGEARSMRAVAYVSGAVLAVDTTGTAYRIEDVA